MPTLRQLVPEVEPPAYANLRMREIPGDWVETPHGQVVISCDDDDAAYENDILGWLAALDGYFGLVGASERERIRVATSCLAGLARAWWNTRCADAQMGLKPPITSWEVWKHEFVARFKPWDYTRRCWSTLFSLHPKNHANLSDFSTEFMETVNKLLPEGLTEEAMLALYCRLVEPELRWVHVAPAKLRDCTSIWDAIMSAIRYAKLTSKLKPELLPIPEAQLQQLDPESTAAMRVAPDPEPLWVRRRKRRSRPRRNTLKSILHAAGRPPLSSLARAGSGKPIPLTKRIRSAEENRVLRRGGRCFICAEHTRIASTCAYRHQHGEWIRTRSSPAFMGHARNSIPQFRSSCRYFQAIT